jgi:hypothetical protein
MAKNFAEIMIKLGLDNKDFDKGVKQTKSTVGDLGKDLLKFGAAMGGVAAGVGLAGKALYEMGKRGAIVTQTADSFDFLSKKLGLAPDLLEQLRKASRGTVDDMTLMSSTATLLAGTSDELGKALGNATPELLEIAKAANKLNPSLGTTSHMYESIALGIKRASPMILDNLGLTIKIGDANEAMAEKLGKSVDALTAEEKQMALLNATLEAGGKLIDQVGGNVDSATDDFARMDANIQNLKDTFLKGLAPAIAEATSRLDEFMTKQFEGAELQKYTTQLLEEKIITEEQALVATMNLAKGIWDLDDAMEYLSQYVPDVTAKELLLEEQMWKTGDAAEQQETRFNNLISTMGETETATGDLMSAQVGLNDAMKSYNDKLLFTIASQNLTADAAFELAESLGLVDHKTVAAYKSVGVLTTKYDKNEDGVIDLTEAQNGYIDAVNRTGSSIGTLTSQLGSAAGQAARLGREIRGLKGKTITVKTKFVTVGSGSGSGADYMQHGGPVSMGSPYIVGEAGPELFVPNASGMIVPNDVLGIGSNMMAGISVGVRGGYSGAARDTMSAMGGLVKSAEKALGIASPSQDFYDIGRAMMRGLEMGIERGTPDVNRTLSRSLDDMHDITLLGTGRMVDDVERDIHDLNRRIDEGLDHSTKSAARFAEDFSDHVRDGYDRAREDTGRAMHDIQDIIKIGLNEVMYVTDEFADGYIDLWDKTAEGTRKAALSIMGDLNDVIGFVPPDDYWDQWRVPDDIIPPDDYFDEYHPPPRFDYPEPPILFPEPEGYDPDATYPYGPPTSGSQSTGTNNDMGYPSGPITNNLIINTNAEVTPDVPDLLLLRAWSNG